MPTTYELIDNDRGVFWSGAGIITADQMLGELTQYWNDARLRSVVYVFHDYSGVTEWRVSTRDISEDAAKRRAAYARHITHRFIALYAPLDEAFGLARMWLTLGEVPLWETEISRCKEKARAWLRLKVAERFGFQICLT